MSKLVVRQISFGDNFLKETSIRYGGIEIGEAVFSLIGTYPSQSRLIVGPVPALCSMLCYPLIGARSPRHCS